MGKNIGDADANVDAVLLALLFCRRRALCGASFALSVMFLGCNESASDATVFEMRRGTALKG